MKKLLPLILILLNFSLYCEPKISLSSLVYDLGRIFPYPEKTFSVWIENTGDETLRILDVESFCGCTTPNMKNKLIKPGEKSELKIVFDPSTFRGSVWKTLQIRSNDPRTPRIPVRVNATIIPEIQTDPQMPILGPAIRSLGIKKSITIKQAKGRKLVVKDIKYNKKYYNVNWEQDPKNPKGVKLNFEVLPNQYGQPLNGIFKISFSEGLEREHNLSTVVLVYDKDIISDPGFVQMEYAKNAKTVKKIGSLTVKSRTLTPFRIIKIDYDEKLIKVSHSTGSKSEQSITISPVFNEGPAQNFGTTLVIETDSKINNKISVPVFAYLPTEDPRKLLKKYNRNKNKKKR